MYRQIINKLNNSSMYRINVKRKTDSNMCCLKACLCTSNLIKKNFSHHIFIKGTPHKIHRFFPFKLNVEILILKEKNQRIFCVLCEVKNKLKRKYINGPLLYNNQYENSSTSFNLLLLKYLVYMYFLC